MNSINNNLAEMNGENGRGTLMRDYKHHNQQQHGDFFSHAHSHSHTTNCAHNNSNMVSNPSNSYVQYSPGNYTQAQQNLTNTPYQPSFQMFTTATPGIQHAQSSQMTPQVAVQYAMNQYSQQPQQYTNIPYQQYGLQQFQTQQQSGYPGYNVNGAYLNRY